jgi:hypothetical protein
LLGFLACDERKGLALGQVEKSVVDLKLEKIAVYTRVISVGSQCATAGEIQRFGLKKASYPFDWLYSSLGMVADCIEDDFADFLDRSHHEVIPIAQRVQADANFL